MASAIDSSLMMNGLRCIGRSISNLSDPVESLREREHAPLALVWHRSFRVQTGVRGHSCAMWWEFEDTREFEDGERF